ncbi:hypothetical protein [Vineibacter terrae]|uniref:hypothetical protein n=1 Tax=Vineibacter terrae TaxID=2586908 RepID=UPI002E33B971|nr:hypothetical protein [Vineibacter terrae]HEX2889923.1 hypothetical protein [Vineibacter terrae]
MADRSMVIRMALALCAISAAAGCAAPQYDKPVGAFATATSDAQEALAGYSKGMVAAQEDRTRNSAVAAPYRVRSLAGECGPSSTRCRLVLYQQQGDPSPLYQPQDDPQPQAASPVASLPGVVTLMGRIARYAESLNAIVTSDSAASVETSAAAAGESISGIAALMPGAAPAGGNVKPSGSSIGWMKADALKQAVSRADPVLAKVPEAFGATAQQATVAMQAHMADVVAARRAAFRARSTRENLDRAAAAAEAYDAFLRNDATPAVVLNELVKAHADLNQALQSNASPAALAERMNAFQAHAARLAKALGALQQAQAS